MGSKLNFYQLQKIVNETKLDTLALYGQGSDSYVGK